MFGGEMNQRRNTVMIVGCMVGTVGSAKVFEGRPMVDNREGQPQTP